MKSEHGFRKDWDEKTRSRFVHKVTGVVIRKFGATSQWTVLVPERRGARKVKELESFAHAVLHACNEIIPGLLLDRELAHAEALEMEQGRAADRHFVGPLVSVHSAERPDDEEVTRRIVKRAQYEQLCELLDYGIGAYAKARIMEYAHKKGVMLPGMRTDVEIH